MITPDILRELVRAAIASPSVHNTQPARWRIEGDTLILLEDTRRRLNVGDPGGHDALISLGAAAEGMVIAASAKGLTARIEPVTGDDGTYRRIARFTFDSGAQVDPLAEVLAERASWRGDFHAPTPKDRALALKLEGADRTLIAKAGEIGDFAKAYDSASLGFMRNAAFRAELVSWMRLSRSHGDWARDGLNAQAMSLSLIEAISAGAVLGPLFAPLNTIGLARPLLAEAKSFHDATGVVLFHRARGEDPFTSGRHFHRLWLEIDALGFGANVLAAVADDDRTNAKVCETAGIVSDQRLISAFRFGRRKGSRFPPARLPLEEVLLA